MPDERCPVCDGSERRLFRRHTRKYRNRTVRCLGCGLYYTSPLPDAAELAARVGGSAAYTQDQIRKRAFFTRRAERVLDRVERLRGVGRLLDVGCAIGTELHAARGRGWQTVGIELSTASVEIARADGLDVRGASLEEAQLPAGSFDLITLNHVLEHVARPDGFMAEIRRLLAPGGLLFISISNVHTWKFYVLRKHYHWSFHDDHFLHFTPGTLRRFLERHHWRVLELETSRWLDFHEPIEERSALFRRVNAAVEARDLGIEIFCLAEAVA